MWKDLKYLLAYIIPFSGWASIHYNGIWSWSTIIVAFAIIPLLDAVLPASSANIPAEQEESRSRMLFFDILLFLSAPICYGLLWYYFDTVTKTAFSNADLWGKTLCTGVVLGALGINVAHELGHRTNRLAIFFAKAGLLPVLYQHFIIEHNRGHHKLVATDADPATSRKNEWLYAFFIRSIAGQYVHAWKLESTRLGKKGISVLSLENAMIRFTAWNLLYLGAITYFFGFHWMLFALVIAFTGIILLETINYIEHYGLKRNLLPDGKPEMVTPKHSWNSDHEMGRIMLFELTRHSDHHYRASRKFQILRHLDESPQLPTGYPGSMLMAAIPPLWFRVMNKRLK
jgi:alkane 1-monooxygenase